MSHGVQEGGPDLEDQDGGGSDAESDGYGEAGLSWEAVMQSMQVRCCCAAVSSLS